MTETFKHALRLAEAILFASPEPMRASDLAERLPQGTDVPALLERLAETYRGRGMSLVQRGDAWAFRTAFDLMPYLQESTEEPVKLGRAALETAAIIAYHQPITRGEIEAVRGVGLNRGTLDALIGLGWVKPGRRKRTPGRPLTWMTTPAFLDHFGLESLDDLPRKDELEASGLLDKRPAIDVIPSSDDDVDDPQDG
ncbi:MAG: SMC-Scp complex subunit ScpB [Pseudomonadota bacterium]|nr:SMC-Scp complex subunit ScpB [Pseudomonadota bacterium]